MANIGTFIIPAGNWVKLEDIIKEKVTSFTFTAGTTYLMQNKSSTSVIEIIDEENTPTEGLEVEPKEKFTFTYRNMPVYVKAIMYDAPLLVTV